MTGITAQTTDSLDGEIDSGSAQLKVDNPGDITTATITSDNKIV